MSKEEILEKHTFTKMSMTKYQREDVLSAMQEFADLEKEKVAVAFAEWKDEETIHMDGKHRIMHTIKSNEYGVAFDNNFDLYQYFINNVYNQNHPL